MMKLNTTLKTLNSQLILKTWINIWTLLNTILAIIISLCVIIYVIIVYVSKKKCKKYFHVSLILTSNTCLTIICTSIIFCMMSLSSLGGDRNIISLKKLIHFGCYVRGYLTCVFVISMYLSYVLQACYRLFRIVYHKHKYLRKMSTFSYYIFAQWILSFVLTLPILFSNRNYSLLVIYLLEDFNCLVPFTHTSSITFIALIVYISPLCCLCLIYSRIIIFIRYKKKRPSTTLKLRRQTKRDASVIKRIYIVIIILWSLGFPALIVFITFKITGHLHWSAYRLCGLSISMSFLFMSLSSLYVTPQIYKKIRVICGCAKDRKKHHRVSYSISINMERERKIKSLLLENTTFTDPNMLNVI